MPLNKIAVLLLGPALQSCNRCTVKCQEKVSNRSETIHLLLTECFGFTWCGTSDFNVISKKAAIWFLFRVIIVLKVCEFSVPSEWKAMQIVPGKKNVSHVSES